MKKLILAIVFALMALPSFSQTQKDEVAIFQNAFGIEKRTLIENYMKIDASKAAEFWKLYEAYETSRRAIGLKNVENINKYADNNGNI